jgi:hypothetical protein
MLTEDRVALFGLIALKALAEHDRAEFIRCCDKSKGEISKEIDEILAKEDDPEARFMLKNLEDADNLHNSMARESCLKGVEQMASAKSIMLAMSR